MLLRTDESRSVVIFSNVVCTRRVRKNLYFSHLYGMFSYRQTGAGRRLSLRYNSW